MTQELRWIIAVTCTFMIVILQGVCIGLSYQALKNTQTVMAEQQKIQTKLASLSPLLENSSMTGNNDLSLKRMINSLNTIERFIRTTPLVECGNWNDRQQKERTIFGNDK